MVDYEDIEKELTELSLTWQTATDEQMKTAKATAQDKLLGVAYLMCSDKHRFGKMVEDIDNAYLVGRDEYPKSVNDAYYRICNWSNDQKNFVTMGSTNDGLSFAQATTGVNSGGKKSRDKSTVVCHRCKELGHFSYECPAAVPILATSDNPDSPADALQSGTNHLNIGDLTLSDVADDNSIADDKSDEDSDLEFSFHQNNGSVECTPCTWILLDNQSTVDVFFNPELLSDIRTSPTVLKIHCNAGIAIVTMVGELAGYGTVWFHPDGIANILSLSRIKSKFRVTYDSHGSNQFIVQNSNGAEQAFKQSAQGLFFIDMIFCLTHLE